MKQKCAKSRNKLWVAVKVERGYVAEARIYKTPTAAEKIVKRWKIRLNPDYDEAAVVMGSC